MNYIVQFARNGNPNHSGTIYWPTYDERNEYYLEINKPIQTKSHLRKAYCDLRGISKIVHGSNRYRIYNNPNTENSYSFFDLRGRRIPEFPYNGITNYRPPQQVIIQRFNNGHTVKKIFKP